MQKVKKLLGAGIELPMAIKAILAPRSLKEFAEEHGRSLPTMSKVINGAVTPTDADVEALMSEFGGTAHEWRMLLWEQSKPTAAA